MAVRELAARIHRWAIFTGLMHSEAWSAVNADDVDDVFPQSAVEVLRARKIRLVGFNDERNEVIVFTQKAVPFTKRVREALVHEIDGVRIVYRQGVPSTIGSGHAVPQAASWTLRAHLGENRYACGSSISVGNSREAGTLGALVRNAAGELFGLSNNHVTGSCNYAARGLPIVAPGILDVCAGGVSPFTIGFHEQCLKMHAGAPDHIASADNQDAAIFRIANPAAVTSWQGNSYDTPSTVMPMVPNMTVEKVGRTSGSTAGRVVGQIYGAFAINYSAALYNFAGPVYYEPMFAIVGIGDLFSDAGDSGSLITHVAADGTRSAVGIVVGGLEDSTAPGGKLSLALPIDTILAQLQVTLVSGHNA